MEDCGRPKSPQFSDLNSGDLSSVYHSLESSGVDPPNDGGFMAVQQDFDLPAITLVDTTLQPIFYRSFW